MTKKKKLKVGCYSYEVEFDNTDSEDFGKTNLHMKTIFINTKFPVQVQRETLNHEILHISMEDCPALTDGDYKSEDGREEDIIRQASPRQTLIYTQNPWARIFVFGGK